MQLASRFDLQEMRIDDKYIKISHTLFSGCIVLGLFHQSKTSSSKMFQIKDKKGSLVGHTSVNMPELLRMKLVSNLKSLVEIHRNIEWKEGGKSFEALHFSQYMRCGTKVVF